ncbi:serine hydrolase [Mycobacterium sp. GA-1199]|uniref:serine hydrolase n=1 Tax=Mycobacterium sp. GA-1199 TaxID=1772287 RepID=UPI000B0987EE|nr:serine hydrolase [Mycobacterium sp. GA-1199]
MRIYDRETARSHGQKSWLRYAGFLLALLVVAAVATALALVSNDTTTTAKPAPQTLVPEAEIVPAPASATVFPADVSPQPLAPAPDDLAASFAQLQQTTDAQIGVAIAPLGTESELQSYGDWTVGPAWSTIKVPLAIAALRQSPSLIDSAAAAITRSDNAAADALWQSLGDPDTAAASVEAVLREVGDPTTVESRKVRPEFSAFGQTEWSLTNQARFLAATTCAPQNGAILDLMTQVAADQRWGLGSNPGASIKGGWGPDSTGHYMVRQIGVLDTPTGRAAVAIAATPNSGSFDDGVSAINTVADWLRGAGPSLPSGSC